MTVREAFAASGATSAIPVADTLTVFDALSPATTVVDGVQADRTKAAAATGSSRARRRYFMGFLLLGTAMRGHLRL